MVGYWVSKKLSFLSKYNLLLWFYDFCLVFHVCQTVWTENKTVWGHLTELFGSPDSKHNKQFNSLCSTCKTRYTIWNAYNYAQTGNLKKLLKFVDPIGTEWMCCAQSSCSI